MLTFLFIIHLHIYIYLEFRPVATVRDLSSAAVRPSVCAALRLMTAKTSRAQVVIADVNALSGMIKK